MSRDATLLVDALRCPVSTAALDTRGWTALLSMARAEQLVGTLAARLKFESVPPKVAEILDEARLNAEYQRRSALWEAVCTQRALSGYTGKVVLLKGTAYVAAALQAGEGRHIGDLDIMVAREDLPQVEAALLEKGGWEWVKPDPYDDAYYRLHMHELPPLIHRERDRMIDVHHTILPLTARRRPDAGALRGHAIACPLNAGREEIRGQSIDSPRIAGLYVLSPADMICHSSAHLFADGDLAGGLRNLWDIHCLLSELAVDDSDFWPQLSARAARHQLLEPVERAARLAHRLYGTDIPQSWDRRHLLDGYYVRRMTARDGWGRPTRKLTRLIFYIRSHWLRMPPLMLVRHLWTKWRKG
jgi:Uncharacterised nucleotidyltransferase